MRARHGPGFGLPFQALPAMDRSTSSWFRARMETGWLWRRRRGGSTMAEATRKDNEDVYSYQHAGIQERHGAVPLWLKLVVAGLLIWGAYYMIQYWSTW